MNSGDRLLAIYFICLFGIFAILGICAAYVETHKAPVTTNGGIAADYPQAEQDKHFSNAPVEVRK